ncbi:uncharacterized protein LOC112602011 [Melanaphis sacchari]|uniref:uncharacterized protein LOC112602011 n=1 Tax=Melanaphis sacchari TaxID=742174 RepID=UPI000DC1531C|nr:uncharacterized protein LOC112602011 [Melanaphis sacchari]
MDNLSPVIVNAGLEALTRFFGDLEFELTQVPSALIHGSIVGVCSLLGGLVGGRFGIVVGGGIGHQINNFLLPSIRNVGNMLRELHTEQLQNLFDLLISRIQNIVSTILDQIVNQNQSLTDLLERFGNNSEVRMVIIQTLINFFSGIHGGNMRLVNP